MNANRHRANARFRPAVEDCEARISLSDFSLRSIGGLRSRVFLSTSIVSNPSNLARRSFDFVAPAAPPRTLMLVAWTPTVSGPRAGSDPIEGPRNQTPPPPAPAPTPGPTQFLSRRLMTVESLRLR